MTRRGRHLTRRLRGATAKWRRLVSRHAEAQRRTCSAERERYAAVHGELLKACEELAREETLVANRTRTVGPTVRRSVAAAYGATQATVGATRDAVKHEGRGEMIRQLNALVRPWTHPKTIQDAPKEIVQDLLAKQRALEERITGASTQPTSAWIQPIGVLLVIGVTAGVTCVLLFSSADNMLFGVQSAGQSLVNRVRLASAEEQLIATVVLAWAVGTSALWTVFRR